MSDTPRTDAEQFQTFIDLMYACGWRAPNDAQHEKIRAVYDDIQKSVASTRSELAAARAELATMTADRNAAMTQIAMAEYERDNASAELANARQRCGQYVNIIVEHAAKIKSLRAELVEASDFLRECIANFGELCAGGDKRWRKAAGVDR